jgi:hypothetical protein
VYIKSSGIRNLILYIILCSLNTPSENQHKQPHTKIIFNTWKKRVLKRNYAINSRVLCKVKFFCIFFPLVFSLERVWHWESSNKKTAEISEMKLFLALTFHFVLYLENSLLRFFVMHFHIHEIFLSFLWFSFFQIFYENFKFLHFNILSLLVKQTLFA